MKCNPDPTIMKTMAALGTGFDCASKTEIKAALDVGASPTSIVYANPCKQPSHIRYAASMGVRMMTFDNADEVRKIASNHPHAQLILRLVTDDSQSICQFSIKFGASLTRAPVLLKLAKSLNLDVIGVSFHVGSGCCDPGAYELAIANARSVFDLGKSLGHPMSLLDVGGGFPGGGTETGYNHGVGFHDFVKVLALSVDKWFPASEGVRVIAEPGRYFVFSAFTLGVNIIAKRSVEGKDGKSFMYYVNDGMYGSFNCITFDHALPEPHVLSTRSQICMNLTPQDLSKLLPNENLTPFVCSIWGPTCDSIDCISKKTEGLPELFVGDWL